MGWPPSTDGRDGNRAAYDSEDNGDENQEPHILSQETFITQLPYQSLRVESPHQPLATKPKFDLNDNALAQQLLAKSFDSFVKRSFAVPESSTRREALDANVSNDESPTTKSSRNNFTRASRCSEVVKTRGLPSDLLIDTSQRYYNSAERMNSRGLGTPQLSVESHFLAVEARQSPIKNTGNLPKGDLEESDSVAGNLHSSLEINDQITTAESSLWRRRTVRGRYVPRFAKMIAKKQQAILDQQEDGWQPPYVGRPFRSGDVPIQLLNLMTKFADDTAEAVTNLQKETWMSGQTSREDSEEHLRLELTESALATRHPPSPAMQSSPPSSTPPSWSSSEYGSQRKPLRTWRELPPDSSPLRSGAAVAGIARKSCQNTGSNFKDLISSVNFAHVREDQRLDRDSNSEDEDKDGGSVSDVGMDGGVPKAIFLKRRLSTDTGDADEVKQGSSSTLGPAPVKSRAGSSKKVQVSRTPSLRKAYPDIIQGSGEILTMPETNLMRSRSPRLRDLPKSIPPSSLIIPATAFGPSSTDSLTLPMSVPPSLPRPTHSESDTFEHNSSEDDLIYRGQPETDDHAILLTGHTRSKNLPFTSKQDLRSQTDDLSVKDSPNGTTNVIGAIRDPGANSTYQFPVQSVPGVTLAGDYQVQVPGSTGLPGSKRKHAECESEHSVKRRVCLQPQSQANAPFSDPAFQAREDKCRQLHCDFGAHLAAEESDARSSQLDTAPAVDDSTSAGSKDRQTSSQSSLSAIRPPLSTSISRVSNYNAATKVSEMHVPARCSSPELQGAPEESSDLFHRFRVTYPLYRGKKYHFDEACALLQRLGDAAQHPSLWDDFVFRYYNDYVQEYLPKVQEMGRNAIHYENYYRDFIEEPQFLSKVIKRNKTQMFSVRTSVLHSDSHERAAATRGEAPSTSLNHSMDVEGLNKNFMEPVQPQPTYPSKAEATEADLRSKMEPALTPSHGSNHSQDLSVKLWLERASGAESPELGTLGTAKELAEIPLIDIDARTSSPVKLLQPQPRHQEEDPVANKAVRARGIAKRNGKKSSARRAPETPFSKLGKEFADLDSRRWVVHPERQRVIDIFMWRK